MSGSVSRRAAGQVWLTIDNYAYSVVAEPSWSVGSVNRETLVSLSQIDGYKETIRAPHIAATIRDTAGTKVRGFQDMTSCTVTLRMANGKEVSGEGMWNVGAVEVNANEATFAVRFEGELVEEL